MHDDWVAVLKFVTDAADEAVLLPICAAVAAVLAAAGWWRATLAWIGVVASGLTVIVGLKLAASACAALAMRAGVVSPSGHTAVSAMIAGGLVALLMARTGTRRRIAAAAVAASATSLLIGLTRVGLGVHTVMDVVVAAPLGVLAAAVIGTLAADPPRRFQPARLIAVAIVVGICLHGFHLHAETIIRGFGHSLKCPA